MTRTTGRRGGRAWPSYISLFTSLSTLACCALPALLVLLGLGATVASVLSAAPWLVWLSHHKQWVFGGSGAMNALSFYYVHRLAPRLQARELACPIDAPRYRIAGRFSRSLLTISIVI